LFFAFIGFSKSSPSFLLSPQDKLIRKGEPLLLECLISGVDPAEITWWKNSVLIPTNSVSIGRNLIGSSSLYLQHVSVNDAGIYECRADSVKLRRRAEVTVREENRLKISGLLRRDQAVYQCVAENDVGSVQASAQLIVESSVLTPMTPTDPVNLRTTKTSSRFVSLAWDQPFYTYGLLTRYQVYYKENGTQRCERIVNATENYCTVFNLQPNTRYMFRVVAVNQAGTGKSSGPLQVTTSMEQLVPGKVKNLNARAVGPETIEVNWDPPVTGMIGTEVKNYILFYVKSEEAGREREIRIMTTGTSYTLRGMLKYTQYKIRVEANGSNGSGLTSEVITVTTFSDVPSGSPLNVRAYALSTKSIKVKWDSVEVGMRNGDILGYQVKCKAKGRDSKADFFNVNRNDLFYIINGLEREMEYHIRVAAVNVNGSGPFSEAVKVVTLSENLDESHVPPSPKKLILNASVNSILVLWDSPSDSRIMIRKYQLGWGPSMPDIDKVDLDVDARNYTITGLDSGREYVVSLRAVNAQGPGYPIYESATTYSMSSKDSFSDTAASSSLRPPVQVIAETLSSTSIFVSWLDLNNLPLYDRSYTYGTWFDSLFPRLNSISLNNVTVEGLYPNTLYGCVVRVNYKGSSSFWSLTAENATFPSAPSSAPCDLTVNPLEEDPHTVVLNWQPPKYANGEIIEYIVYYTYKRERSSDEWDKLSISGDQMTCRITDLIPHTTYFFKVQARNVKGLSPLSKLKRFDPSAPLPRQFQIPSADDQMLPSAKILSNSIFIGVVGVTMLLLVILILLVIWCMKTRNTRKGTSDGYVPGMKTKADGHPDLWIDQGSAPNTKGFVLFATWFTDTGGTLTRSYHQSSSSLESRQRTPQVMSAASNRYLSSAKIDYSDHGSSYGSSQALQMQTPPPQLPNQGPPSGPPSQISDAYRTLRSNNSNPLRSFTQFASVPPPVSPSQTSPSPHGNAQVPVGRATVHRVNVNNIYQTFGSSNADEKPMLKDDVVDGHVETQTLQVFVAFVSIEKHLFQQSNSTEELNAQMENLDTMIDDLQAMQHEFSATS
uniref:Down syndrome cell adhesion molecule a n=1 Tax=Syphacia muris TaxID=451379 RepID=A0A0N5API7_9BILA